MQHLSKKKTFLIFVVASLIFYAVTFLVTTDTITNVSAVKTNGVGVYWDNDCSNGVSSIDWGTLEPGSSKNIVVYIRNEVDDPCFLSMSTINWNPSKAFDYITLGWDYAGWCIDPGEALQIKLILSVSHYIEGISNFSFDILIAGIQNFPGDLNGDGHVNISDLSILADHWYGHDPTSGKTYDPRADINLDGLINLSDLYILAANWSKGPLD